ncbi:MAG: HD domain-containing protein, partial [bacterium]
MNFDKYSPKLHLALTTTAKAHHQQYRKGTNTPYFTHPVGVAIILDRYGFPESWVLAGLLHDVLEDTDLTTSFLEKNFGNEVTEIVLGCSEPYHNEKPWFERKKHTIDYLRTAPLSVKVVSCADKLHNLLTILNDLPELGEQLWQRFRYGKEKQGWYYSSLVESLLANLAQNELHDIFHEYKQTVNKV